MGRVYIRNFENFEITTTVDQQVVKGRNMQLQVVTNPMKNTITYLIVIDETESKPIKTLTTALSVYANADDYFSENSVDMRGINRIISFQNKQT